MKPSVNPCHDTHKEKNDEGQEDEQPEEERHAASVAGGRGRRHPALRGEAFMKITVIKKTNGKVKTMALCPWILDEPPAKPS